jgi:regulator of replication initiation timing
MALLPHTDYFYDLTGFSAYILLNGDADLLRRVVDFLQENDIVSTGSGASRYPARSGAQYQWFIRVTDANGAKPDSATVHSLMRSFRDDSQAEQLTNLSAQLEELDKRLKMQVENNRALAAERESLKHTTKQREIEISQLWGELESYERIKRENDEFIAAISEEVDSLKQVNQITSEQLVSTRADNERLIQQLSEGRQVQVSTPESSDLPRLMEDYEAFLKALMPNATFMRDSFDIMKRLADPRPVLERIGQIVVQKQNGDQRVRSAEGWWEMHFNTGQDDNGRIYYRISPDRYEILVSFKGSQKQDFVYLRNC